MQRRHGFVVLLLTTLCLAGRSVTAQEITWLRSAEQAAMQARDTGKPILIYVRSENCRFCDLMQENVWKNPTAVSLIARDFIPLKLTREENPEALEVLRVKRFPTTLIFTADRKYVDRIDGYLEPDRFLTAAARLRTGR